MQLFAKFQKLLYMGFRTTFNVPTFFGTTRVAEGASSTSSLATFTTGTSSLLSCSSSSGTPLGDGRLLIVGLLLPLLLPGPSVPSVTGTVSWAVLRRFRAFLATWKTRNELVSKGRIYVEFATSRLLRRKGWIQEIGQRNELACKLHTHKPSRAEQSNYGSSEDVNLEDSVSRSFLDIKRHTRFNWYKYMRYQCKIPFSTFQLFILVP